MQKSKLDRYKMLTTFGKKKGQSWRKNIHWRRLHFGPKQLFSWKFNKIFNVKNVVVVLNRFSLMRVSCKMYNHALKRQKFMNIIVGTTPFKVAIEMMMILTSFFLTYDTYQRTERHAKYYHIRWNGIHHLMSHHFWQSGLINTHAA